MTHPPGPRRGASRAPLAFAAAIAFAAALALLATTPLPAIAQQAPARAAPAKPAPTPAPPAPAPSPAASAPAPAPPAEPPSPIRTEILALGNWTVTCREFAPGGPRRACQAMLQVVRQGQKGEPGEPLLTWTIAPDAAGKAAMTLQTPTGVMIAPGVELTLGKASARRFAFTACEARCATAFLLDDALEREAMAADSAEIVIISTKGDTIRFTFPVAGVDRALASLR
jgi:invasion protein IalB